MKNRGIVIYDDLLSNFRNKEYVAIIDSIYNDNNISIENYELRIFPKFLKDEPSIIDTKYREYLKEGLNISLIFRDQNIDIKNMLLTLSDMKGRCIDASKNDALFTWHENVILYYNVSKVGNAFDGFNIKLNIRIGGENENIYKRALNRFIQNLNNIYGDYEYETDVDVKKKLDEEDRDIVYDVALSFAGEQRVFVNEVADIFRSKGIEVFYDEFYEGKLWGEDLHEYLWRVYYKESKYCIMFISKEYTLKAWPTHEKRAALAREVQKLGGYILPVRFDYSEVPGLAPGIKHLKVNVNWPNDGIGKNPSEIVEIFIEKVHKVHQFARARVS